MKKKNRTYDTGIGCSQQDGAAHSRDGTMPGYAGTDGNVTGYVPDTLRTVHDPPIPCWRAALAGWGCPRGSEEG